ncbi:MAG: F0F1 ATP synthase subunit epsilon [Clostridia bacterium]|nr:F0F1 ATP synthase subunit epsilon [Clostridia bacterium]
MTSFDLKVVTMSGIKYDGKVIKVIVRTAGGDMCVLANHTDYASPLGKGKAKIVTEDGKEIHAECEGGFISVQKENTRIVATRFEVIE